MTKGVLKLSPEAVVREKGGHNVERVTRDCAGLGLEAEAEKGGHSEDIETKVVGWISWAGPGLCRRNGGHSANKDRWEADLRAGR